MDFSFTVLIFLNCNTRCQVRTVRDFLTALDITFCITAPPTIKSLQYTEFVFSVQTDTTFLDKVYKRKIPQFSCVED